MTSPEVDRISVVERIYRSLREDILQGRLTPRERLTTSLLAEQFGASRTPVRAALVRLEAEGLVTAPNGRSAWVRSLSAADVMQAYDVAMGLEGSLVYRLAQTATGEQLDQLREAVDQMERAAESGDKERWASGDVRFHSLLAEFGENRLLGQMMNRVHTDIARIRLFSLYANPGGAALSAREHRAVAEAIGAGDHGLARRLHQDHWERAGRSNVLIVHELFESGGVTGPGDPQRFSLRD